MVDRVHDVAIVGMGPVGQTCALLLARLGYDVVVLERWPQPYRLPRAVHFDHEIGRVFDDAGVGAAIRAITDPVPDHYEWRAADGRTLLKIDWSGIGPSGWPVANFFSQPELEDVLTANLAALPSVQLNRGVEVVRVADHGDAVELRCRPTDGTGETSSGATVRARYVIGADGANSVVRQHMATEVTDTGFAFDWLIVDLIPHEQRSWSPMNWQLCDPARPTTVVSGGPGRRRWEFLRLDGESVADLDSPETAWRLLEPWGRTPENSTLERHAVYRFQARWADRWRDGRLLLAGDAAHQMPPFAGQGMCSGIRDAANLVWKLDLVLREMAPASLLDTYASERSAHVQHAIHLSVELGKVICVLDPAEAEARNERMMEGGADPARVLPPAPPPVLGEGVVHASADDPLAGTPCPQFRLAHQGRSGTFDEIVGPGFAVVALGRDPRAVLGAEALAVLAKIGAHLVQVVPPDIEGPDIYLDLDLGYTNFLTQHAMTALIVRPDHYVYAGVPILTDLGKLVTQLRHSLLGDPQAASAPSPQTTAWSPR